MEFAKGAKVAQGSVLILPDDRNLTKIEKYLGASLSELKTYDGWQDFINYVTFEEPSLYDQKPGRFTSLGGLKVGVNFGAKMIVDLNTNVKTTITKVIELNGIKIITISGILITQELKDEFTASEWVIGGYDVFFIIASKSEPRDVVRLCGTNRQLRAWCDESFYAGMLRVHFNRESDTPKETYLDLVSPKVWACGLSDRGQLGLGKLKNALIPTLIPGLNKVVAISTGGDHSLFIA